MGYRILIFSWNTESIPLCGTVEVEAGRVRRHMRRLSPRRGCDFPDFQQDLNALIEHSEPDIVVIGFQEDRKPGSHYHSQILTAEMPKIGFQLVKKSRMMGLGVTTVKGLKKGDILARGLRTSVYAHQDIVNQIEMEELQIDNEFGNHGQSSWSYDVKNSKGAIASYIRLPGMDGCLAFINAHLPFNAQSLIDAKLKGNPMLRQNHLNRSNTAFNNIVEHLVLEQPIRPSYVFLFGDLNYRIQTANQDAQDVANALILSPDDEGMYRELYQKYDELHQQMERRNIYSFDEGVNNQGPMFLPTCKMVTANPELGRDRMANCYTDDQVTAISGTDCWNTGRENQRIPSWCDRILYREIGDPLEDLRCQSYYRFDTGLTMGKSDHAAVYAVFDLTS